LNEKGNNGQKDDKGDNGKGKDRGVPVVPEANAGWVLGSFFWCGPVVFFATVFEHQT
jgi:hypothetical protein